jgi:hypothetical protein
MFSNITIPILWHIQYTTHNIFNQASEGLIDLSTYMLTLGHIVPILARMIKTWKIGVILVYPWWHSNALVVVLDDSWKISKHRHMQSTVLTFSGKRSGVKPIFLKSWCILKVFVIILEAIMNSHRDIVKVQSHCPECCPEWPRLAQTQFVHGS